MTFNPAGSPVLDTADGGLPAAGRRWPALLLPVLASASGAGALALQYPVLTSEPLFTLTNAAVTAAMVTLGSYLVIHHGERFTGLAFVVAGIFWPLIALDVYPGWGPYLAFIFGGGATFFVPLSWGILRYGRSRLAHRSERLYIPVCALLTSGAGAVFSLFTTPEWMGLPATARWPTLWFDTAGFDTAGANKAACTVGAVLLSVGFNILALYFLLLVWRVLREAPPTRRDAIRPLCAFGAVFGVGSGVVYTITTIDPQLLPLHALAIIIGALALILTGGLGISMARQDLLSARFVDRLPDSRTPESVARYLKEVLRDETAELLYLDPDSAGLIDADGRRRPWDRVLDTPRFHTWIWGSDGLGIGLLSADPLLENDKATLASLRRIVTILAENARLQAVLRMRVAQLTATRTAQQLAFEQAREEFHRDLHDGLQQTIAAALMDLEGLAEAGTPAQRRQGIALLESKLRLALEEVHSLKRGVHPPELQFGLKRAIDRVVGQLRLVARSRVTEADLGVLTLPIYYIIRESLTNVHKHAQAGTVEIDVSTDGRMIDIRVHDDGIGGAADRGHGGIGGMRQRVEELGGHFQISSPAGMGTTVTAQVSCVSSL